MCEMSHVVPGMSYTRNRQESIRKKGKERNWSLESEEPDFESLDLPHPGSSFKIILDVTMVNCEDSERENACLAQGQCPTTGTYYFS